MHHGVDVGTPLNTEVIVDGGQLLTTWDDKGGGGITNQYAITGDDGRAYEILLMHGSDRNPILSSSAVTDGKPLNISTGPSQGGGDDVSSPVTPAAPKSYSDMSASEINSEYDKLRMAGDRLKATNEGMQMHRAYFGK